MPPTFLQKWEGEKSDFEELFCPQDYISKLWFQKALKV